MNSKLLPLTLSINLTEIPGAYVGKLHFRLESILGNDRARGDVS